jgi:hypothetical protein
MGHVSLEVLLRALHAEATPLLVEAPGEVRIGSAALLDLDDVRTDAVSADLCLHAGVPEAETVDWLRRLDSSPSRPRVLLAKTAVGSAEMVVAARAAGVALVGVAPTTRSETLMAAVRGVLDEAGWEPAVPRSSVFGAADDLYDLAHSVAALTRGLVSIEDERSRMLAYSVSDESADELRTLSILGREGPAGYLRRLREWGVYDRLRQSSDVVVVPPDPALGMRRRLAVSIRSVAEDPAARQPGRAPALGTIWVQEGREPFAADTNSVLMGAAAVAARLIARTLNAPSNEAMQVERLLGTRGEGVDVPSLAAALAIPTTGPAVVIGFRPVVVQSATDIVAIASALRLHVSAYARQALVSATADRIYVLIPRVRGVAALTGWTDRLLGRLAAQNGMALRAAVAAPVGTLADVAAARAEVDRVLDRSTGTQRVTTLAESRTSVLLGEIIDLVAAHPELTDPRMATLQAYDAKHDSALTETLEEYLLHFGDVRSAAEALHIHPNTVRYRLRRAEQLLEVDFDDPGVRLLVQLQLLVRRRGEPPGLRGSAAASAT